MRPIVQAFLLADGVYKDRLTGKVVIAGCFNRVIRGAEKESSAPPGIKFQAGSPFVYVNLVDVKGEQSLDLRWVDLSDNRLLVGMQIHAKPPEDPLDPIELIIRMPLLPYPHPGVYAMELLTEDEPLASWRVTCVDAREEGANT